MKTQYSHDSQGMRVYTLSIPKSMKDFSTAVIKKMLVNQIKAELKTQQVSANYLYQKPHIKVTCPAETRLYVVYQTMEAEEQILHYSPMNKNNSMTARTLCGLNERREDFVYVVEPERVTCDICIAMLQEQKT